MEAPNRIIARKMRRSRWCFLVTCGVVLVVILAVMIPVAVIYSKPKHSYSVPPTVLMPLYIYPDPGAWDPLYEALAAHPGLNFTLIINPDNGPGPSQHPSDDYVSQIQKLNTYFNVRMLGYVRTGYATRNMTSVLQDMSTYSDWDTFSANGLGMHGIFFDEVPSKYASESAEYLKAIDHAVKKAPELQHDRMVIHNPGTIPDVRFNDSNTDVTVVFEGSYQNFKARQADLASLPSSRSKYSYLLNSIPTNTDLRRLVDSIS